jgi:hypothetical protein
MNKTTKNSLDAGDVLFKAKDFRGALIKYERALGSTPALSTEEKTVNIRQYNNVNLIKFFACVVVIQHGLIQSGLCYHGLKGISDVKPALDCLRQAISISHPLPALSWMVLNATIHGFRVFFFP